MMVVLIGTMDGIYDRKNLFYFKMFIPEGIKLIPEGLYPDYPKGG